jgi:RNA-binding protein YhbY
MTSDDSQIKYCHFQLPRLQTRTNNIHCCSCSAGSTDWKAKYNEVADMLTETRAELDEFHTSSKELEEELIKEIDRTEKAQQDLKVKVSRTETERDEWKVFFCEKKVVEARADQGLP